MAKKSKGKDAVEKARRRLAKAQLKLHGAQEKRSQVMASGERDVEAARERAAASLARATERVEQRSGDVAQAEAKLLTHVPRADRGQTPAHPTRQTSLAPVGRTFPEAGADAVAATQSESRPSSGLLVPDSTQIITNRDTGDSATGSDNSPHTS